MERMNDTMPPKPVKCKIEAMSQVFRACVWSCLALVAAAQEFDSFTVSRAMAPMRDGVRLAADV